MPLPVRSAKSCLWGACERSIQMRLSRHARNEMRLYGIGVREVEVVLEAPLETSAEHRGNLRLVGEGEEGRRIVVVVAGDDPEFVITVFRRG